jgi:hypothetical protein
VIRNLVREEETRRKIAVSRENIAEMKDARNGGGMRGKDLERTDLKLSENRVEPRIGSAKQGKRKQRWQ